MKYQELREMAYTRQIAISIMIGAEAQINDHLIKIFLFPEKDKHHWVAELLGWYERIGDNSFEATQ